MRRIVLAFQMFFGVLFNARIAAEAGRVWQGLPAPAPAAPPPPPAPLPEKLRPLPQPPKKPARSEALSLLAALQRETRFVDFVQEKIDAYSDAQVGAAVRDIHRGCAGVLERMFGLQPVVAAAEGSPVDVPTPSERFRLTGRVEGEPPFHGRLVHPGWEASRCEIPAWTGSDAAARVVAPAEVEVG